MLERSEFESWLAENKTRIIDGGLATELEARGHNLNHELWSATVIQDQPDDLRSVHLDYFLAGADVAITASYQASTPGLEKHLRVTTEEAKTLVRRTVQAAHYAREEAYVKGIDRGRKLLIAGSVGPFGAYLADGSEYRGDYTRSEEEFKSFHRPRIQALIEGGVDILALETMPSYAEMEALLSLLEWEFPDAIAWLSCTIKDARHLSDGTDWGTLLNLVNPRRDQIVAFGINCVPIAIVTSTLGHIRFHTSMPLVCYPNSGETWEPTKKVWCDDATTTSLPEQFSQWKQAGAQLIGGCCRTGPGFVRTLWTHQHGNQPVRSEEPAKRRRSSGNEGRC